MPSITAYKSIVVTGATSGLGRALAIALSKLPSKPQVIGLGRRKNRLEELAQQGIATEYYDASVGPEELEISTKNLLTKYPDIDAVIFCAGIQQPQFFATNPEKVNIDDISKEFYVNYLSIVSTIKFMLPHFLKFAGGGRKCSIITMTSALGITPGPFEINYSASKAALHSFTMSLRTQLKFVTPNIHVVEIIPPLVESELHDAQGTTEALSKFWMPLEDFTNDVIDGLSKGEDNVTTGMATTQFEKFENGKQAVVDTIGARSRATHGV